MAESHPPWDGGQASVQRGPGTGQGRKVGRSDPHHLMGHPFTSLSHGHGEGAQGWLSLLHVTEPRPGMNLKDKGPAVRPQVTAGQVSQGAGDVRWPEKEGCGSKGEQGFLNMCRWGWSPRGLPARPLLTRFPDGQAQGGCGVQQHPAYP